MVKAADALAAEGYNVCVVSAAFMPWAHEADFDLWRSRAATWDWRLVDLMYGSRAGATLRTVSGIRHRVCRAIVRLRGAQACSLRTAACAINRAYPELFHIALDQRADLYIGGTSGGLAVAASAGRALSVPYALDLEDFHTGEHPAADAATKLMERIERDLLPGAAFVTAGSDAISEAYEAKYGVRPITIHNAFPLPAEPPPMATPDERALRLYWFSQTIGPGRGIESAVEAMGLAQVPGELHLRGRAIPEYVDRLRHDAALAAPRLKIVVHEPGPPDAMVSLCHPYDVGLALEQPDPARPNQDLLMSNKALTYVLGGLPVAVTDTAGQRAFAADLGKGALVCRPGDTARLAAGLERWATDRQSLREAKAAAWEAAKRRWHWEHEAERGALVKAVRTAFS